MKSRSYVRLLAVGLLALAAHAQSVDEYRVKAAFLYNFAKFVEWPATSFKSDKEPIRICVLGENPFGRTLADAVEGKSVLGRALVVVRVSDAAHARECHELFVSTSERKRWRAIFDELRAYGVLTVGEADGFATEGGIVNFKLQDGRIRLEINVGAASQANLRINPQVLVLSQLVGTKVSK